MELKPCPFCGGKPELIQHGERFGYGSYEQTRKYWIVKCKNCTSSGKGYEQKPLCDYTNHTVDEFRDNPILRAKVEDDYDAYIEQTKHMAMSAWNQRND